VLAGRKITRPGFWLVRRPRSRNSRFGDGTGCFRDEAEVPHRIKPLALQPNGLSQDGPDMLLHSDLVSANVNRDPGTLLAGLQGAKDLSFRIRQEMLLIEIVRAEEPIWAGLQDGGNGYWGMTTVRSGADGFSLARTGSGS